MTSAGLSTKQEAEVQNASYRLCVDRGAQESRGEAEDMLMIVLEVKVEIRNSGGYDLICGGASPDHVKATAQMVEQAAFYVDIRWA